MDDAVRTLKFLLDVQYVGSCMSYTSGLRSCYDDPKNTDDCSYTADQVCGACIIDRFLRTGKVPQRTTRIECTPVDPTTARYMEFQQTENMKWKS